MKDLSKGNIYKTFFLFGLPLVLSGVLSQTYHIVDTSIAGKFFGETGLGAIGATAPLISFISSLFWGYGVGFGSYIGRLFGAGEYGKIKSAIYSTYFYMIVVCVLMSAGLIAFHKPLFDFLNIEEGLRDAAFEYFLFYILGLPFIVLSYNGIYMMNAFGIGGFPFFMSLLSAVINITGNLFTIMVLGWGLKGLSIATVFASMLVDIGYFIKLHKCFREMNANEKPKIGLTQLRESLPFALPNMAQQMVMYFSSFLISPLVNGIGPSASASYSVVSRVYDLNASVYQNSARAIANYSSQCVGHKKYNAIKKGVFVGLLQGIAFVTPFVLVCCIFPEAICSLFLKSDADTLTKSYSYSFAKYYLPFIYINLVCNLFHGLYRGVKATGHLFLTTLLGAGARFIFSALLVPAWGMHGFYTGWVLSWCTEAIVSVALFFLGKWNPQLKEHAPL